MINRRLAILTKADRPVRTVSGTGTAAHALRLIHVRLSGIVLLHLSGTASAAHTDILQAAAEAGSLVALEVGQRNEHVGIHNGTADLRRLYQLAANHRDFDIVRTLEAVGDDHLAARGERREAIFVSGLDMIQSVLAPPHIQCIAIRQERLASQLFDDIRHCFRIIRTQIRQVARLTKMDLDCHKLVVHIDCPNPRTADQLLKLQQQVAAGGHSQIAVKDL